jgi:lipopolysaccharide transport system permease protein
LKAPKSVAAFVWSLWDNRRLIYALVYKDIQDRYKGSFFGLVWSVLTPIFMLLVFTFVFSVVFPARWGGVDSRTEFALLLFAGLILFNVFAETLNASPKLVINNANYVKKVVFPVEVLPAVVLGSSFFNFFTGLIAWIIGYLVLFGLPPITFLLFPIAMLPVAIMSLGFSCALSSLGVYVRDIGQLVGTFVTALLFLSPIFYSTASLSEKYRFIFMLNPLAAPIENLRQLLFWGAMPDIYSLIFSFVVSICIFAIGIKIFIGLRDGFSDVL